MEDLTVNGSSQEQPETFESQQTEITAEAEPPQQESEPPQQESETEPEPEKETTLHHDAKTRVWTSANGKFTIKATLLYVVHDPRASGSHPTPVKVILKKADGTKIDVPLDKLSDADRDFVKNRESVR